jgi:hypothetical protein
MESSPVGKLPEQRFTKLNNRSKLDEYTASELNAEIYIAEWDGLI